jgi:ubiquinone/menaquinone biosynthesis C-methylase UbiE
MIYERYAPVYDASGQIRFALLTATYLHEVLERHPVAGRTMLDLACGTGTLAIALADAGWQVLALDASAAMLAQAAAKCTTPALRAQIQFIHADLRDAASHVAPAQCHLVTCTYDSLNYLLTADDLARAFAAVARVLAPGGIFVADMNTRHFLEHDWGTCQISEQPHYVQIEQSSFAPDTAISTMLLTGFVGNNADGYVRFDETHCARAYPTADIDALLSAAGLLIEAHYDSFTFTPPTAHTQRIFWVARKAAQSSTEQTSQ